MNILIKHNQTWSCDTIEIYWGDTAISVIDWTDDVYLKEIIDEIKKSDPDADITVENVKFPHDEAEWPGETE
jgi:hypothetical protein